MKHISRRDFLKLSASLSLAAIAPRKINPYLDHWNPKAEPDKPNVIIIVFDAMSARHLSLYGYQRETTPNFMRFAEHATVYHSHMSAGNFTTPGTASLLTGTYPWTNRAINFSGHIAQRLSSNSIFSLFHPQYTNFAFAQNLVADILVSQFSNVIDSHIPPGKFSFVSRPVTALFKNDLNSSYRVMDDFLFQTDEKPASLVFGQLEKLYFLFQAAHFNDADYPLGFPHDKSYPQIFNIEDLFQGILAQLSALKAPYFSYIHFYPPHEPYRPRKEFNNLFNDSWKPVRKPNNEFSSGDTYSSLITKRRIYDKYIANIDADFGKFMDSLDAQGVFKDSIVIVTSDHGQLFERGVHGHFTPLLYEPIIHIPLMISMPGQTSRVDVHSPTSSIDILPTLLHLTGQDIPDWCEGEILPGFDVASQADRAIFSVEAKYNSAFDSLNVATIAMRKGPYKMIYFTGYKENNWFEMFDLESDPEELKDIYKTAFIAREMRAELMYRLELSNKEFLR